MSRSYQSHQSLRRIAAAFLSAALLAPVLAAPIYADPTSEIVEDSRMDSDSMPVWNGGAADRYSGSGTKETPYLISSGEELALLAQQVRAGETFAGKYFLLSDDILLNDTTDYAAWSERAPARRWIPIGGYATVHIGSEEDYDRIFAESGDLMVRTEEGYQPAEGYQSGVIYYRLTAFSGIFDGGGHTIGGLYTADRADYIGLFGACENAVLKNLNLTELYVRGNDRVGGLVGSLCVAGNLTIDNCKVKGSVIGNELCGGLVGYARSETGAKLIVSACSFNGDLNGSAAVGGILGGSGDADGILQLSSCKNYGQISGESTVGGIAGKLRGNSDQITTCQNTGAITANEFAGGIVGLIDPVDGIITVSNCQNGGTLLGHSAIGGIVGGAQTAGEYTTLELLSCRNVGELIGRQAVGGIIGQCKLTGTESSISLSGNKNSANIRGKSQIGGIVGFGTVNAGALSIGTCENYGAVTASDGSAGGILGQGESAASLHLFECSVHTTVTVGKTYGGGIVGYLSASQGSTLLERCSAGGTVKADLSADGAGGSIAGAIVATEEGAITEIRNCLGAATISAKSAAGGIAGEMIAENGQCRIISSLFCGGIYTGCKLSGGIVAIAHAKSAGASVQVVDCYYSSNTSSRAMYPYGGEGTESCLSTEALSDQELRNPERLGGLDFSIWQATTAADEYPSLQSVPFVWEEYQYTVTRDGAMLNAYLGRSDIVVIPDKLGGVAVTTISDEAFWQSAVIRVTMPNSVTAIGEAAFAGCTRLERVTLSAGLISIGARAFKDCTALNELRCTGTLSTLMVGGENEPYSAVGAFTPPATLQIVHSFEDGSSAGKGAELSVYPGDYYEIAPLSIEGYVADDAVLSGICGGNARITVTYRIGTYHLSIRYLYPDGTEALPSYEGDYQFGESYQVTTPVLSGYSPDSILLEGSMPGHDTTLTVYFSEIFTEPEDTSTPTLEIILLILSGLMCVCCLVYFIYRYRSSTEPPEAKRF